MLLEQQQQKQGYTPWSTMNKKRAPSPTDSTEGMSEFSDMHQGLDGIIRVESTNTNNNKRRRRRYWMMNPLHCILLTVLAAIAITTVSVMIPLYSSSESSYTPNAYEEKVNDIYQFLVVHDVSNEKLLLQAGSPQYEAMHWLAVHSGSLSQYGDSYAFLVRYVMALTFFALDAPLFTFDASICEWFRKDGVDDSGIQCNMEGLPVSLNLEKLGLSGQIPTEFGLLTTVQHLNLADNQLEGIIPSELCNLSHLEVLNLSLNSLTGSVPSCMGAMESLELLNLNFNQMTGSLPEEGFANLRQIYLNSNRFSQALSNLVANMYNLHDFSARDNNFYGQIEFALDHLAEQLVLVDVTGNQNLSGEFPKKLLHSAPNLQVLALGDNALTGKLTWFIPRNEKLKFLSIHGNDLTGIIPPSIANLTALTHFIASDNQLAGPIPETLPAGIQSLFLNDNDFSPGPIPESWASLNEMVAFHMGGSSRTGTLPAWIGQNWTKLEVLDVGGNNLEGDIPDTWSDLAKLEYLFLNENQNITGSLPASFNSLTSLKQVLLFQTGVSGDWQFMCENNVDSATSVLGTRADDECSCCVLCDDWSCASEYLDGLDESFDWKYRSYWGV